MSTPSRQPHVMVEHTDGGVAIVTFGALKQLKEELQIGNISDQLMDLIERDGVRKILIDLKDITYVASGMLGKLISLHKRLVLELKGKLVLAALAEQIREVFQITRLNKFFKLATDRDEALKLF